MRKKYIKLLILIFILIFIIYSNITIKNIKNNQGFQSNQKEEIALVPECTSSTQALLKGIILSTDSQNVELDQIDNFDSNIFTYEITVPYEVTSLNVKPLTVCEGDTYTVTGNEDFEINITSNVIIEVTSKSGEDAAIYLLKVMRKPKKILGTSGELKGINITNHNSEISFSPEKTEYTITLASDETYLHIYPEKVDSNASCEIVGNEALENGSTIEITCVSEDGEDTQKYAINIVKKKSSLSNIISTIIKIIILAIIVFICYKTYLKIKLNQALD